MKSQTLHTISAAGSLNQSPPVFVVACQLLFSLLIDSCVMTTPLTNWSTAAAAPKKEFSMILPAITAPDITLVMRDAGETNSFIPLANSLRENKKICILALGQVAYNKLRDDPRFKDVLYTPDMVSNVKSHLGNEPSDLGGGKGHTLGFAEPNDAHTLAAAFRAPVVVTGVVSRAQAEFAAAMRKQSSNEVPTKIIGYYDSLALNKNCFLFQAAALATENAFKGDAAVLAGATSSFPEQLDELWIPYSGLRAGVAAAAKLPESRLVVVGSPSTEATIPQLVALEEKRTSIRLELVS